MASSKGRLSHWRLSMWTELAWAFSKDAQIFGPFGPLDMGRIVPDVIAAGAVGYMG